MRQLVRSQSAYELLEAASAASKLSHAYLLTLDDEKILRSFLKECAAVYFPASVLDKIRRETFSDCLIFPKENGKFLVEDAERIIEESLLKPIESDKKLFLITDFSKATPAAQNKLLKLLEDPPKQVYFLIGSTSTFSVLPTVLSRLKTLEISPFSTGQVTDYFKRNPSYPEKQKPYLSACAAVCGGKIGLTEKFLKEGLYAPLIEHCQKLLLGGEDKLSATIKKACEIEAKRYLFSALSFIFKDALLIKTGLGKPDLLEESFWIKKVAQTFSERALLFAQKQIAISEKELAFNAPLEQCLQICLVNIFTHA